MHGQLYSRDDWLCGAWGAAVNEEYMKEAVSLDVQGASFFSSIKFHLFIFDTLYIQLEALLLQEKDLLNSNCQLIRIRCC